jgi:hypothetical protein
VRTIAERHASAVMLKAQSDQMVAGGRLTAARARFLIAHSRVLLDRPRLPFSGGDDTPPDEATIRRRVRVLIDGGFLPRLALGHLIAATCSVERHCAVCGGWIRIGEPELEIASRIGAAVIHLHRRCLDVWTDEARDGHGPPNR